MSSDRTRSCSASERWPSAGLPSGLTGSAGNPGQATLFEDCEDASPFLSRCTQLDLSRRDLCGPFAELIVRNCRAAGLLNGKPDSYYVARMERFLKRNKNNCRTGYSAAEAGYLT